MCMQVYSTVCVCFRCPCRITACKAGDYNWLCCTAPLILHPHLHTGSGLTWLPTFSTLSPFHTLVLIMYQCFHSLRLGLCYSFTHMVSDLPMFYSLFFCTHIFCMLTLHFMLHIIQMGCNITRLPDI